MKLHFQICFIYKGVYGSLSREANICCSVATVSVQTPLMEKNNNNLQLVVCKKVHVLFTFLCCLLGHSKYHVLSIVLIYAALSLVKFNGRLKKY